MNPNRNDSTELEPQSVPSAPMSPTRTLFWSVQRELWENRFIYLAPLFVASVVVFASLMNIMMTLPGRVRALSALDAAQHPLRVTAFHMAPAPIMLATFIIGVFYCLDALYGERRDRSILFWKSLPVSDRTTVLSKASIPAVVLPLIAFALSVATQTILLFASTAILLGHGLSPAPAWAEFRFFQGMPIMIYGLTAHVLWFAPIYAWLLLLSVWARRAPFLWAILPPLAVMAVEKIVFNTSSFVSLLKYRVNGAMAEAFTVGTGGNVSRLWQLDPVRFLSAPGLWAGLAFAAVCLAAAVRLRRNREPI